MHSDYCSALMVGGQKFVGVEAPCVRFERTAASRDAPDKPEHRPIWTFTASAQKGR